MIFSSSIGSSSVLGLVIILSFSLGACTKELESDELTENVGFDQPLTTNYSNTPDWSSEFDITFEEANDIVKRRYYSACGHEGQSARNRTEVKDLEKKLRDELWKASYCETDSDCIQSQTYIGPCCENAPGINKSADTRTIKKLSDLLNALVPGGAKPMCAQPDEIQESNFCHRNKCI